jgi:hypothetical protein
MPNRYLPVEVRFWQKVDTSGDCWEWIAGRNQYGYGTFRANYKHWLAHRWAYTHLVAPIPDGLQVDHLCRNRGCVNPAHMELVTSGENTRRGISPSARNARKTHCIRGHEYTAENTEQRTNRKGTYRVCLTCRPQRVKQ